MRPSPVLSAIIALAAVAALAPAEAQTARPRPATPASAPASTAAAPVAAVTEPAAGSPQQTTATFEDWMLRCTRPAAAPGAGAGAPAGQFCEIVQTVTSGEKTVAQIAIGRAVKGQPLLMTVLAPVSVSFGRPASLMTAKEGDAAMLDLAWRRCVPGGCLADSPVPEEVLRRVQAWTEPARVVYADAGGRAVALPFSSKGLTLALNALAKGEAE